MQIKLIERHKRYLKSKLILRRVAALLCSISLAANQVLAATTAQTPAKAQITSTTSKGVFQFDNMSCSGSIVAIKSSLVGYAGIQDIMPILLVMISALTFLLLSFTAAVSFRVFATK